MQTLTIKNFNEDEMEVTGEYLPEDRYIWKWSDYVIYSTLLFYGEENIIITVFRYRGSFYLHFNTQKRLQFKIRSYISIDILRKFSSNGMNV